MKYQIRFTGRQLGAIGIFHDLPLIEVEAETREEAVEKTRAILNKDYEHVHPVLLSDMAKA